MLVSQQARQVEVYSRQDDGAWLLRTYDDGRPAIDLPSVHTAIALPELYRGVLDAADASA